MSTKIYDAYMIDSGTDITRMEMIRDLRKLLNEIIEGVVTELYTGSLLRLTEKLKIYDIQNMYESVEKTLFDLAYTLISPQVRILKYRNQEKFDREAMWKILSKNLNCSIGNLVEFDIDGRIQTAKIDKTIGTYMYNFDNSIVFFPLSEEKTLIMVFGQILPKLMMNIEADECSEFKKKYNLVDYHYQNQTDMPDYVTEQEWEQRCKDWDKVMPTGIPSQDGILVNIDFDDTSLFLKGYKMLNEENNDSPVLKNIHPIEDRKKEYTNKLAKNKYYGIKDADAKAKDPEDSAPLYSTMLEFDESVGKGGLADELIEEQAKAVNEVVKDIDASIFGTKLMDWCPNYASMMKKEYGDVS